MILGFYGPSNTGKTDTIVKLVKYFSERNFKVATVKHISREFTMDTGGKDTWKMGTAGANLVVASSNNENNFIVKSQMDFKSIIQLINLFDNFDLIFVEGFKSIPWIKKIKFGDLETMENTVMKFNNNIDELIKYIENELKIEKIMKKLPNFNCGECGFKTCRELAEKILINEKGFKDCKYFNPEIVMEIEINGKQIYISPFVQNIIKNTIFGMVSSLKGVNKVNTINIKIKEMDGK
ncbi:MAG: molybdopterin-guanine dinucleotide biosynthesis protein B [Thermoplasmata archaeon]